MHILLLTNRQTLPAKETEQNTAQLWTALNAGATVKILELLPYPVQIGLALCHPFSRPLLARYGIAGILPEALSLKKRLVSEIQAEKPAIVCLLDTSLIPLAICLRSAFPHIKICLLSSENNNSDAPEPLPNTWEDLFDLNVPYIAGQEKELASAVLKLAGHYEPRIVSGFECLEAHSVFNPLTRFFVTRLLYWGQFDETAFTVSLSTLADKTCNNVSLEVLAHDEGWTLFQVMAVLPVNTKPEEALLTICQEGLPGDRPLYSGPLGTKYQAVCGNILTVTPDQHDDLNICWWFHKPGVSLQPGSACSRTLEIKGHDLVVSEKSVKKTDPISIQTPGSDVSFSDQDQLYAGTSDACVKNLKNIHKGKVAWLIGNGPSVRHEDLERLNGELTFGFNRLHLAYGETDFRPDYIVCGDRQMIADFGPEIATQSAAPVFLASETKPELAARFTWLRQLACFPAVFSLDPTNYVTAGGSSVYVAMQLAFYMGVRKFYLYGADFHFTYARPTVLDDRDRSAIGDNNHFIKNYRNGLPWSPPELRSISSSFLTADILMRINAGFVRNTTRGGSLEIFDRVPFEEALRTGQAVS